MREEKLIAELEARIAALEGAMVVQSQINGKLLAALQQIGNQDTKPVPRLILPEHMN